MRVLPSQLVGHRFAHMGVDMAHAGDIVVAVEIVVALRVEQMSALTAHDMDRLIVEQRPQRAQHPLAPFDQRGRIGVEALRALGEVEAVGELLLAGLLGLCVVFCTVCCIAELRFIHRDSLPASCEIACCVIACCAMPSCSAIAGQPRSCTNRSLSSRRCGSTR